MPAGHRQWGTDKKKHSWTYLEVKFERDNTPHNNYKPLLFPATAGSMINQRKFQDQKVYSHRWPKLPNEHVESFILLTQGQSF
mgnify:CR=1 FL=1